MIFKYAKTMRNALYIMLFDQILDQLIPIGHLMRR